LTKQYLNHYNKTRNPSYQGVIVYWNCK